MTATLPRVLWLTKGLGRGGVERLLVDCAAHIDRDRFDVEVAYLLPHKDQYVPALRRAGIPVHCLGRRPTLDPLWTARLRRLVRRRGYRVVHTHLPVPAVGARIGLAGTHTAVVHTEHNVWQRYRRPTYWANALTYRRNDAVVAVSQAVAESVRPRLCGRIRPRYPRVEVLLHGIDPRSAVSGDAARGCARDRLGLPQDADRAFVVGTVGNLTGKKDHRTLLEAFRLLGATVPDATLVVVGAGPLDAALRAQAAGLGEAGRRVIFLGSRDDARSLLPAFDVFALSSRHEGLPIALVEALAAGLPAVVTRVGGVPEVVRHGVEALLVPPGDPAALAAALATLADDPGRRAAMAAAATARARDFDIRATQRRLEDIYAEVLARGGHRSTDRGQGDE